MDLRRLFEAGVQAVGDGLWFAFTRSPLVCWFDKPDAPDPPDYAAAAKKEGEANVQAAIAQALLAQRGQVTPFGTLSYNQTGTARVPGVGAQPGFNIPTYSSTTNLTPEGNQLVQSDLRRRILLAGLATDLTGQASDALGDPLDFGGLPADYSQAAADATYNREKRYLDPQWEQGEEAERTRLANSGFVDPRSEGYGRAISNFFANRDRAYGAARERAVGTGSTEGLTARKQAIAELLAKRSQPLAELSSVTGGAAPPIPQFDATTGQAIQGTQFLDAASARGAADQAGYAQDVAAYNNMVSGLFGLGGAAIIGSMMGASDERIKEDIRRVGTLDNGLGVYLFRFKGDPKIQMGVMAQEVEKVHPELVYEVGGVKHVLYGGL